MSMSQTSPSPPKSLPRKPRAPRRPRRAVASSDDELDRIRSSDSGTEESDSDTCSSSEDALDTPAPPATATDHSASPPSTRRAKKRSPAKADPSVIPPQSNWDDLVGHDEALDSSGPPIIDFADFVSGALDAPGPSHTEPDQEGGEPVPVSGRGKSRPRGGKTQRQAYLERLSEDPSYTPRVGAFWGHDERLLAPELRGMSDWWRGRWSGRGRGARGRSNRIPSERPSDQDIPEAAPIERTWAHDGFERLNERDYRPTRGKGRARARGRGGSAREPEQLWTKAPDTHLHIDPSTRPEFPGQGRGIRVNLPGQWRPSMVRVGRNPRPAPAQPIPKAPIDVPTEIVVKLPGKDAKVVSVSHSAPAPPTKSTLPEDPETVQPLQDVPPKVVARIPRGSADTASTKSPAASSPVQAKPETLSRPAPTSAFPFQVLNQTPASVPPKSTPPVHGRTRSQLDAVAFARPPAVPLTDAAVPLAFGSFEPPVAPVPAPPLVTSNTSPSINPPAAVPPLAKDAPPAPPPLNIPRPISIRPPPPPMASFTPPPTNPYYNPYTYNPLDGATYYSTATPPPPHHPGMYYPANGFFVPPRPSGPVAIRAPGESANPNGVVNGEDSAARPPVPPMWNYYHPHPISHHSHSHSHSHGHNSYYSPSATPYPPPPPGPHQPGYYPGVGEYGNVYDYSGGGVYY